MSDRARPLSTYRLQLHAGFPFEKARALVGYLTELGVSHVYVSPILRAEKGSTHGYNVCAHDQINPELGGEEGFVALSDALRARGLGLVVDLVPNHMGIASGENAWWNDVLENGPSSRFADSFDIEWTPTKASLKQRVLYPILGAQYGEALENGELVIARQGGAFELRYYDHRLPVAPRSLIAVFEAALANVPRREGDADRDELESILTATRNLPPREETANDRRAERAREKEIIKRRLDALCEKSAEIAGAIDGVVTEYNGRQGDPRSFDRLDALLREQSFRLSYWRVATEEINYRRFFDVNQLVAVRMELESVFDAAHALVFRLIGEGRIDGLRLDHTDGLYDPADYFARLRQNKSVAEGLYVIAEKILEPGERLPRAWKIEGTTGYDALGVLGGVWVDGAAEKAMTALYRDLTGDALDFESHVHQGKRTVIRGSFAGEMNMLAQALERIAEGNRRSRDFTLNSLRYAIVETISAFAVYRTYVRADGSRGPNDDRHITSAIETAKRRNPDVDGSIFAFLRDVLLLREVPGGDEGQREKQVAFAMRFQQLTGPIMAKGVEDTAFYRYLRLASLNEVGGEPSRFGAPVAALHEACAARVRDWPLSMVATSTHDTKRGEDVRARLAVITERPERWEACVGEWRGMAEEHRRALGQSPGSPGSSGPSALDEYLFFQTVLGAWPFAGIGADRGPFTKRIAEYMTKAMREAKLGTSWLSPNEEYEKGTTALVESMLGDEAFVRSVRALADKTATYAASSSLGQVALKLAGPGVPDTYQGCELWSFALVDPDNRTPVDYDARRAMLRAIRDRGTDRAGLARGLLDRFADGAVKLFVTHTLLSLRRDDPALLRDGGYRAIDAGEHAIAFVRESAAGGLLACVVPRLTWKLTRGERPWALGDVWGDRAITLPGAGATRWTNVLTGETHAWSGDAPLREVLSTFPIAVMVA